MLREIWLQDDVKASINATAERSGSRSYLAYFDQTDDENFVLRNCGFGIFQKHPTDFGKMIDSISADCMGPTLDDAGNDVYQWAISISYGPTRPGASASQLDMAPKLRVAGNKISVLATEDRNGVPILNTVGDPYDPPVESDDTSLTFYVKRNEAVGDIATAIVNVAKRSNKVNAADWNGFPAGTLKTTTLNLPDREYDASSRKYFYPMEYGFEFKEDGWSVKVLNAGYRYKVTTNGVTTLKMALVDGQPASVPVLLDEDGNQLAPPVDKDNIVINEHDVYYELDFGEFGMDDLLAQQNEPLPPDDDGTGGFG